MLQINQEQLRSLMQSFYLLTNIRMALFDREYTEIISWPEHRAIFCETMRKKQGFSDECKASDRIAFERSAKYKEPYIYSCHSGLTEAVIQITSTDSVLGYVMIGQVISEKDSNKVKEQLSQICIAAGNGDILGSIDTLPVKTEAEIKAAANILLTLSEYILSSRIVMIPKKDFIDRLNTYIFSHISEKITVGDLCKTFKFGKTHLYKLAAIYLNHSIADYIRNQRILHAKTLLKETVMPIKEIAVFVGFSDYNYFSRCFKENTGMNARDYRTMVE